MDDDEVESLALCGTISTVFVVVAVFALLVEPCKEGNCLYSLGVSFQEEEVREVGVCA